MAFSGQIHRVGGSAAIICALTYLFGFGLFFGVLEPPIDDSALERLNYLILKRDSFFIGHVVIGIVFRLSLLLLNQSLKDQFYRISPNVAQYNSVLGIIWATLVLASTFIFLTSLSSLARHASVDHEGAILILNTIDIVVNALGGGIELLGAMWVLLISLLGWRHHRFSKATHSVGILVGLAGILTLFSGLSLFADNGVFQASTAIFGLGQIIWFLFIGVNLLRHREPTF